MIARNVVVTEETWSANDKWSTPSWLVDLLDQEFHFTLDAAAIPENAKCDRFFSPTEDGLQQDWSNEVVWLNPPYNKQEIGKWVEKAYIESTTHNAVVVMLIPMWNGYAWWDEYCVKRGEIRFMQGTVSFTGYGKTKGHYDLAVVIFRPGQTSGTIGPTIKASGRSMPSSQGAHTRPTSVRKPKYRLASDLTPKAVKWLWPSRIPQGEITLVEGDPSVNKSSLLVDLAARVSSGREMPDGSEAAPGGVLMLLGEDSLEKTVIQRLDVAGANRTRIAVLDESTRIPDDLNLIEETTYMIGATLFLVDPLVAFLTPDSNSDQKVRQALTRLKQFAERTGVAVVIVRHLNKRGGKQALYRGSGSIGIIAATRSALLIGKSPDDPNLRVMCQTKSNLGPLSPSLLFEPVSSPNGIVQIEWHGECEYTPENLLAPPTPNGSRLTQAMSFLVQLLANGPVEQSMVKFEASKAGLAYRTVERAKEILNVISERKGWGPGSTCYWRWPVEDDESHRTPTQTFGVL